MTDIEAAARYGQGWRAPDTMPHGVTVEVLTARGLRRQARRAYGETAKPGPNGERRVHCWRYPQSGDLIAMAWRELG